MPHISRWFLRIAVIYALVGMLLGIAMGMSGDHSQYPTHAHINLVGWVSMAIYALVYRQYPAAAGSALARVHFWVANAGALLLSVGVYTEHAGMSSLGFIVIIGSLLTLLGMLLFATIVFTKVA
jgi:cbb3-type cytochrome oxidase subunit 1